MKMEDKKKENLGKPDQKDKGIFLRLNFRTGLIIVVLAFLIFSRLYNLQEKALMHDECMFTYYSWFLVTGGDYHYQPILHGPVLEIMNALNFIVFGDTTYTTRLFAAICGILLVLLIFKFKPRLGRIGLPAALVLFALSPFLMFYSRFCRNDMPFALFSLLSLYLYWQYFRTWKGKTLFWAILSSMMLICIKENQLIYFFTVFTFAGFMFLVDVMKDFKGIKAKFNEPPKMKMGEMQILRFPFDSLSLIFFFGGIIFYLIGYHSRTQELKGFGFLLLISYFLWMFRRYASDLKGAPLKTMISPFTFITVAINSLAAVIFVWILYIDLFSGLFTLDWNWKIFSGLFILFYIFFFFVSEIVSRGFGEDNLLRKFVLSLGDNFWFLVAGLAVATILYIVLFTTFFKHPDSPLHIYKRTFEYWAGQHKEHRIKGKFHFYIPLIMIYNLPALLIVTIGGFVTLWKNKYVRWIIMPLFIIIFLIAVSIFDPGDFDAAKWKEIDKKFHMDSTFHFFLFFAVGIFGTILTLIFLWRKERLNAFLVYWTMGSFLGYSYAGEKVPWVTVHIMVPMLLLTAIYIKRLWKTGFFKKTAPAWYVILAFFALWNLKSAMVVSFINHSNIAERMIYSHAPMDVPESAELAKDIAFQLGTKEDTQMLVKGWAIWPMRWYLRNYKWTEYADPETVDFPIVIMDYKDAMKVENITENYQIAKHKVIQWWVPGQIDIGRLFNIWKTTIPKQYVQPNTDFGKDIENSKAEWKKIWGYMVHREPYEAHDARYPSMSAPEMALCIRKDILHR